MHSIDDLVDPPTIMKEYPELVVTRAMTFDELHCSSYTNSGSNSLINKAVSDLVYEVCDYQVVGNSVIAPKSGLYLVTVSSAWDLHITNQYYYGSGSIAISGTLSSSSLSEIGRFTSSIRGEYITDPEDFVGSDATTPHLAIYQEGETIIDLWSPNIRVSPSTTNNRYEMYLGPSQFTNEIRVKRIV